MISELDVKLPHYAVFMKEGGDQKARTYYLW